MAKPLELAGQTFGQLTVLRRDTERKASITFWVCKCSCGVEKSVRGTALQQGKTKSCGHIRGVPPVHGGSNDREYRIWTDMFQRCYNPNRHVYPLYGGRGIKVHPRWFDYALFLQDMGKTPFPKAQIDRINTDGDYAPDNCRWVTPLENNRNRRNIRRMTINGETLSVKEWSERTGVSYHTMCTRLNRGWSDQEVYLGVREKKEPRYRPDTVMATIRGETRRIKDWCKILGINYKLVMGRRYKGWSDEDALTRAHRFGE